MFITQNEAADMIRQSGGLLFSVTFIKRSDDTMRTMVARRGVKKGVTGVGQRFSPDAEGLLTVAEFVDGGYQYRNIPIEGIREIKMRGKSYLTTL